MSQCMLNSLAALSTVLRLGSAQEVTRLPRKMVRSNGRWYMG